MVLPRPPLNPQPIPNEPFFYPQTNSVQGTLGPLIIGSGLSVSLTGVLSATGGGGSAGVSSIVAGTGITISSSGPGGTGTVTINAIQTGFVTNVTAVAPITSTGGTTPSIGINSASTAARGAVQLNDTTSSTAVNLALTANQGRALQLQINTLAVSGGLTLAGTINASNGLMVSVTSSGLSKGFAVSSALPASSSAIQNYFVLVTTAGTFVPPGGASTSFNAGDWIVNTGTAWDKIAVGATFNAASTTQAGIVELSTDAEAQAGTNATTAVTPAALQSKVSDSTSLASATSIASSNAVKTTFDLANAALPKAGGTMTGNITFTNDQPVDAGTY